MGIGAAGYAGHALADEGLGLLARGDHDPGTFIARGQALAVPGLLGAVERLGHIGNELARGVFGVLKIRAAGEDGEVRGVDWRRFHLHKHLVARGLGELPLHDLDGQLAVGEGGEKLLSSGHGGRSVW